MQEKAFFKYLIWLFRFILIVCFAIAVAQNFFSSEGTITLFGYRLTQFYPHIEVRILPLLWLSFYLIHYIKKVLKLTGNFYLSEMLITGLVALDAFTHTNGFYSKDIGIYFFDELLWFDKLMHFFEGLVLLVAIFPLMFRFTKNIKEFKKPKVWSYWMVLGYISIFYIFWEILEVIIDKTIGQKLLVTGYYDTNEDLMMAYIGSIVGFVLIEFYYFIFKRDKRSSVLNNSVMS